MSLNQRRRVRLQAEKKMLDDEGKVMEEIMEMHMKEATDNMLERRSEMGRQKPKVTFMQDVTASSCADPGCQDNGRSYPASTSSRPRRPTWTDGFVNAYFLWRRAPMTDGERKHAGH